MAYIFGDSFDLYATTSDHLAGYWDSGGAFTALVVGRFTGSQAGRLGGVGAVYAAKSSGQNDAAHHIVVAYQQTAAIGGTTLGLFFQLSDGATNQVCIVFRSDGAILLTSATPGGTVLDTYTGAAPVANTWYAFEFEVVINNTTGSWAVRKNGNTSNDHALGGLNTRPGANPYANKFTIGMSATVASQIIDDLLWRSDASSVPWVGDIRCYTRMPASDASVQFSRSPTTETQIAVATGVSVGAVLGTARYSPFTSAWDGTITSGTFTISTSYTGNMKVTLFSSVSSAPGAVIASATTVNNPVTGTNTFTFPSPPSITKGIQYWLGFSFDTAGWNFSGSTSIGVTSATTYAAFPVASPTVTTGQTAEGCSITVTLSTNYQLVSEAQQDGTTSYVYDSTLNDADFYNIAALSGTPASTIAVTTRGFMEKSDAGTRSGAVQLKSGATTVQSTSTALSTSFGWLWRTDTVDPATGAAWTATGVNNATIGPVVTV